MDNVSKVNNNRHSTSRWGNMLCFYKGNEVADAFLGKEYKL
jgi:hypothetical protein